MISKVYNISWEEFDSRCRFLANKIKKNKKIKDLFGIPRGGLTIAVRLSHLTKLPLTDDPKYSSTLVVDDILDSGATKRSFSNFKYFDVLVNKPKEGIREWVEFPWEIK